MKHISTPLSEHSVAGLQAGDEVLLSGIIYTARDQAHRRFAELLHRGKKLPVDFKGQIIYYCGPTQPPRGKVIGTELDRSADGEQAPRRSRVSSGAVLGVRRTIGTSTWLSADGEQSRPRRMYRTIGSCGPTTSARMDVFTPALLKAGLKGMIGKGSRSGEVVEAIKEYGAVYFLTYAGCGALLSHYVVSMKTAAYQDMGPEAVHKLEVKDFPLIVGIDTAGKAISNAYEP